MPLLSNQFSMYDLEAGCDEAGRGCLAGPVTAAAVILPKNICDFSKKNGNQKKWSSFLLENLNDSKKLNERIRFQLKPIIEELAMSYSVVSISPKEIDEINILNASLKCMQECVLNLTILPEFVVIDGNKKWIPKKPIKNTVGKVFTEQEKNTLLQIPNECVVKGDGKYLNIAAASVLAKTYRDELMQKLHDEFSMYQWNKNKGYPTKDHKLAIYKYGLCEHHRKSFQWDKNIQQLQFEF